MGAFFIAQVEALTCMTEQDKCANANAAVKFSYGFANGLLLQLDIPEMRDAAIELFKSTLENKWDCIVNPAEVERKLKEAKSYKDVIKVMTGCLYGIEVDVDEVSVMFDKAWTFVAANYANPYFQGQATAFIITIVLPPAIKALQATKMMTMLRNARAALVTKMRGMRNLPNLETVIDDVGRGAADDVVKGGGKALTSEIVNGIKKYSIDGLEIGTSRFSSNGYIGFDIRIPEALQKQGYATQIFEDAISYYKSQGKVVNGIEGKWLSSNSYEGGMSSNLRSFTDDFLHNGKTYEEAALNTPTGKISSRLGFTKVVKGDWDVLELGGSKPAQMYWMELKFKKP